eukprot:gene10965-14684_t
MTTDSQLLLQLVKMEMPFGKYKGTVLCDLPVSYLEWFNRKGFPQGKLGMLLQTLYEIKLNGLEYLLEPLKKMKLTKYKKENKELLTYLLFEAHDEQQYIRNVQLEITTQFGEINTDNIYYAKKGIRKVLRMANKFIKYS